MVVNASGSAPRATARGAGRPARIARAALWHDLECGAYAADLPLWRELAAHAAGQARTQRAGAAGAVLEVGAGTGRVTLDLAVRGHRVTALDRDARLLGALRERASGLAVDAVRADACTFALHRRDFALCLVPMQTVQLLGGAAGRLAFLRRAHAHLAPHGLLACAIVTDVEPFDCAAGDAGPDPEVVRVDGALHLSRVVRVHVGARTVRIERERTVVPAIAPAAPRGAASRRARARAQAPGTPPAARERDVARLDRLGVAQLHDEGRRAGLTPAGTRAIPETDEHAGCVAVLLGA